MVYNHNEEFVALAYFSENVVIKVVYYDSAYAINSFSSDNFYTKTCVTFSLSLYANNLIGLFFVSIYKCVTVMTFHYQIDAKRVKMNYCALLVFKSENYT